MRKNYDFSKGKKNPYFKKLKAKKIVVQPDVSVSLSDLLKYSKKAKKQAKFEDELLELKKRIRKIESKLNR